jgi:hypothetical protein
MNQHLQIMSASSYPLPEGKGTHKNMAVGVSNDADVSPASIAVHLKNTVDSLRAEAKALLPAKSSPHVLSFSLPFFSLFPTQASGMRLSDCADARRELSTECTAKAKSAEAGGAAPCVVRCRPRHALFLRRPQGSSGEFAARARQNEGNGHRRRIVQRASALPAALSLKKCDFLSVIAG